MNKDHVDEIRAAMRYAINEVVARHGGRMNLGDLVAASTMTLVEQIAKIPDKDRRDALIEATHLDLLELVEQYHAMILKHEPDTMAKTVN